MMAEESETQVVEEQATEETPVEVNPTPAEAEPTPEVEDPIAAAQAETADWKARAYRVSADLENMRRRFTKEREELRKFGVEGLLKDLVGVVDNLERAVQAATDDEDPVVKGVNMVLRQFITKVQNYGARPFEALGQPFDPQIHEAMTELPTNEYEPGTVAQVFQRGWWLHERLMRPAMVLVAKAMPEAPAADDSSEEEG